MSIQAEILEIYKTYESHEFDPPECFQKFSEALEISCKPGNECDPREIEKAKVACNAYGYASNIFLTHNMPSLATKILINAWNQFSEVQREDKNRIYRAGIGMYLSKVYLETV